MLKLKEKNLSEKVQFKQQKKVKIFCFTYFFVLDYSWEKHIDPCSLTLYVHALIHSAVEANFSKAFPKSCFFSILMFNIHWLRVVLSTNVDETDGCESYTQREF